MAHLQYAVGVDPGESNLGLVVLFLDKNPEKEGETPSCTPVCIFKDTLNCTHLSSLSRRKQYTVVEEDAQLEIAKHVGVLVRTICAVHCHEWALDNKTEDTRIADICFTVEKQFNSFIPGRNALGVQRAGCGSSIAAYLAGASNGGYGGVATLKDARLCLGLERLWMERGGYKKGKQALKKDKFYSHLMSLPTRGQPTHVTDALLFALTAANKYTDYNVSYMQVVNVVKAWDLGRFEQHRQAFAEHLEQIQAQARYSVSSSSQSSGKQESQTQTQSPKSQSEQTD